MKLSLLQWFFMCNYLTLISCQEQGLVFVFDTTRSMWDDLENFKKGADLILDTMTTNPDAPISDYVLVPFNDPDFGPLFVTKFESEIRTAIRDLKISERFNPDCPEMCFGGLKLALESSLDASDIFVMTDASEKDPQLLDDILNLIQRYRSQVIFLLTEGCKGFSYQNYEKVAAESSGQVFYLNQANDIFQVLKYVNRSINRDRIDISYVINPAGYDYEKKVMVDESIKSVSVIVSGGKPKLEVLNPKGEIIDNPSIVEKTLDLLKVKAVEIIQPSEGEWTVKYGSDQQHTLKVTGISKIKFKHGFTVTGSTSISETTNRPLLGAENSMLVNVIQGTDLVDKLISVKIANFSESSLFDLELSLIDSNLYKTENFVPTKESFYIIVNGVDKKGNIIKRTSKTAIQVQKPEKPYVTLKNEVIVNMYDTLTLLCHVDSLIPIEVSWYKDANKLKSWNFDQSGDAKYEKKVLDKSFSGEYQCEALNSEGTDIKTIKVTVKDVPVREIPITDIVNENEDGFVSSGFLRYQTHPVLTLIFSIYVIKRA